MEGLCRLCATDGDQRINVFSPQGRQEDLKEKVSECLRITIRQDDELPRGVCLGCRRLLQATQAFLLQVQSANEKLLKLVCSGREREEEETKSEGGKGIFGRTRTVRNRDVFVEQDIEDKQLRTKPKSTNVMERGPGKRMEGVKMLRAPALTCCSKCGEESTSRPALVEHWRTCHPGLTITYSCRDPPMPTSSSSPSSCSSSPTSCSFSTEHFSQMRDHVRSHMFQAGLVGRCEVCAKLFPHSHMRSHMKSVHEEASPIPCRYGHCDKKFKTLKILKTHELTHRQEHERCQFSCHLCGKKFMQRGGLDNHLLLHAGVRPFACTFQNCTLAFTSNSALRTHLMVHTGEKPFQCDTCGAKFTSNSHLRAHNNEKHLGIARFHCSICSMKYNRPDQFRKHQMTHTGETPHRCGYCGKGFRRKDTLKKHEVLHLNEEQKYQFPCPECGKRFTQKSNLKTHMKSHQTSQPQTQLIQLVHQPPQQHALLLEVKPMEEQPISE